MNANSTARAPFVWQDDLPGPSLRHRSSSVPSAHSWKTATATDDAYSYRAVLVDSATGQPLPLPLPVEIRRSKKSTTVADLATGIYGEGATSQEATDDFYAALLAYRDALQADEHLSPGLRRLYAYIASLV
jgi:hypothetical protein